MSTRTPCASPAAPAAIGAYSPSIRVDGASSLLFVSGQIGLEPETGQLATSLGEQVRAAMKNLVATLHAAGFGLEDVARCGLYLADMADFAEVNAIYAEYFPGEAPARAAVAVAGLPKGARFEIDAIACR